MAEPGNLADKPADQAAIGAALARARAALHARTDTPQLDAELLLACTLHRPRSYVCAHAQLRLDVATLERFETLVGRRAQGEPLAYLTGEREFWSLALSVTPDVLIPRPETELAVERCLALRVDARADVADLGTGSGAIALALATERPLWRLIATDRSSAALKVARGNARRLGISNVEFLQGDWFMPLNGRRFEIVVSNPPYVAVADAALNALRFEPVTALTPGNTGLEALREIAVQAGDYLVRGGWLVLEHGAAQAADLAQALVAAGFTRVRCHADLAGHDRVTEAQWTYV
jgi:release factor glutamine methyltransferase